MALQFWFEFASTYTYPAAMRIEAAAADRGVAVEWKAFLLGPIFVRQGWKDSPFNIYPAKGRYMWRDLERICQRLGLPLRRPSQFPRVSLLAARIAAVHAGAPWLPAFVRAVYHANFADDRAIGEPAVVSELLRGLGLDGEALIAEAGTPAAKDALRAQGEEADRLGLFGAPSFVVGSELFWGNDRLGDALDWAVAHSDQASSGA